MRISSFNMVIFVSLVITNWTQGQDFGAVVSVRMKKHESFDGNLPVTSACYNLEIENTSHLQCASYCLTRPDVCYGILFKRETKTCKLIKCNPAYVFFENHFDTGKWDLLWKEKGIHYDVFFTNTSCLCPFVSFCLSLNIFVVVGSRTKVFILSCLRVLGNCKPGWFKHEEHCYFSNKTGDTWMSSKVSLLVLNTSNKEHMYMYIVTLSRTGRNEIYGYL